MLKYIYSEKPTPHIYFPELLPPELYAKARFPMDLPVRRDGRTGRDLFMGEPGFAEVVQSDGFRELYQQFTSPEFVLWILGIFEKALLKHHCRVDPKQARLIDFLETREQLATLRDGRPEGPVDVNELFNRFDFSVGGGDYTEYVHLDSIRRIVGGLLFFSDAKKEGMDGGEFKLYRDLLFNNDRDAHWPITAKSFPVKENTGVIFLNCNTGFHGPAAIRAISGSRRWIYYSISSRLPVWERGRGPLVSRALLSIVSKMHQEWRLTKPIEPESKVEANRHEH